MTAATIASPSPTTAGAVRRRPRPGGVASTTAAASTKRPSRGTANTSGATIPAADPAQGTAEGDEQRIAGEVSRSRAIGGETPVERKPRRTECPEQQRDRHADRRRDHTELPEGDGERQGDQCQCRSAWPDGPRSRVGEDQRRQVHDERPDPQQWDRGDVGRDVRRHADQQSAAGSPARTIQEIQRRDVGAGSWTPTAASSGRPLRATTTPSRRRHRPRTPRTRSTTSAPDRAGPGSARPVSGTRRDR